MRAGLLSENEIIRLLNENFVSTWALIDDLKSYAGKGNRLADTLAGNWEYPLDLMFLTADGRFVGKLNSFRDFPSSHIDVGHPTRFSDGPSHTDIFLKRVNEYLRYQTRLGQAPPKQDLTRPQAAHAGSR